MSSLDVLKPRWFGFVKTSLWVLVVFLLIGLGIINPVQAKEKAAQPNIPQVLAAKAVVLKTGDQLNPTLAFNPTTQNFLVVWEDISAGAVPGIWGRLVDIQGNALSTPFAIATDGTKGRHKPVVVYNEVDNQFLVVYEYDYNVSDTDIRGKRIYGNGTLVDETERTFATSTSRDYHPVVVHNADDNHYLVAWEVWVGNEELGNSDIYAQRYYSDGVSVVVYPIAVKTGDYDQTDPTTA